jgi:hypothetical protein
MLALRTETNEDLAQSKLGGDLKFTMQPLASEAAEEEKTL